MKRYDWRINTEGEEEEYSTLTGRYMHADEVLPQVEDLERNIRILTDACESWEQRFNNLRTTLEIAKEFIENQQLPDAEWARVLDVCVKALRQG